MYHGKDARKNDSLLRVLTTQYKSAAKKGCEATLEMAGIIVRAHNELDGNLIPTFYERIGLAPDGSKARKLKRIGELAKNSARLQPYLEKLPSAWTTLYELTKLEADQFQRIMDFDAAHPLATWDELKAVLGRDDKTKRARLHFQFDLKDVAVYRQREFVDRLNALCAEFGVSCKPAKASMAMIESFPSADAFVPNGTNDNQVAGDEALAGDDR